LKRKIIDTVELSGKIIKGRESNVFVSEASLIVFKLRLNALVEMDPVAFTKGLARCLVRAAEIGETAT
jgi:hypothetical protein